MRVAVARRHRVPSPRDEYLALLRHLLGLFLTHGSTQQVRAAQRVAGKHLRDLHHLLLVQDDAVGFFKHRLQVGVQVVNVCLLLSACGL